MIAVASITDIDSLPPLLPDEADMIAAIDNEKRKREMTLTRRLVKKMLGHDVSIGHFDNGKPFAKGRSGCLTISHSGDIVAMAYDQTDEIGIDIQFQSKALQRVKTKFLSDSEQAVYTGDDLLLKAWTIKEAVYKAAGIDALSLFDIHLAADPATQSATVTTGEGIEIRFELTFVSQSPMITLARRLQKSTL